MLPLLQINSTSRSNYLYSYKIAFLVILMFVNLINASTKADNRCDCISVFTYPTPLDRKSFVAKCYLNGEDKGILENITLKDQEAVEKRTKYLMGIYKIKKNACIVLPNGKIITVP